MRLLSAALFAGFVMSLSGPSQAPELSVEQRLTSGNVLVADGVDQIVTGVTVSEAQKTEWLKSRDAYLKCPECVAVQPYPGD